MTCAAALTALTANEKSSRKPQCFTAAAGSFQLLLEQESDSQKRHN